MAAIADLDGDRNIKHCLNNSIILAWLHYPHAIGLCMLQPLPPQAQSVAQRSQVEDPELSKLRGLSHLCPSHEAFATRSRAGTHLDETLVKFVNVTVNPR
jgi:hypothetical protein